VSGHLIRRITKAEDGKTDVYGPYEKCPTCGPLDRMTLDLLGAYRDLLAQQDDCDGAAELARIITGEDQS
jgi:hypothetical protein